MFINFEKIFRKTKFKVLFLKVSNLLLSKKLELKFKLVHLFLPGHLLSPEGLLISENFPSRMLIRPRTFIRVIKVTMQVNPRTFLNGISKYSYLPNLRGGPFIY